jgi:hypothetical protein
MTLRDAWQAIYRALIKNVSDDSFKGMLHSNIYFQNAYEVSLTTTGEWL